MNDFCFAVLRAKTRVAESLAALLVLTVCLCSSTGRVLAQSASPEPSPAGDAAPAAAPAEAAPAPAAEAPAPAPAAEPAPAAAPAPVVAPAADQYSEKVNTDLKMDDTTSWAASLGGTMYTGNTRSYQLNAGSDLKIVRSPHAFGAGFVFAYGKADVPGGSNAYVPTVKNLNAKARYDYFLTRMDGLFVASAFRWDEFAGLDARVEGQLGYLRYFFREDNHSLWGEAGYDIDYDKYHRLPNPDFDPTVTGSPMLTAGGHKVIHSARLFLGYDNKLNAAVTYLGGLEGLMNVESPKDTRIAWTNALRSAIAGNLQLEVRFTMLFDNVPVPGAKKLDTSTVLNLIYNLL